MRNRVTLFPILLAFLTGASNAAEIVALGASTTQGSGRGRHASGVSMDQAYPASDFGKSKPPFLLYRRLRLLPLQLMGGPRKSCGLWSRVIVETRRRHLGRGEVSRKASNLRSEATDIIGKCDS